MSVAGQPRRGWHAAGVLPLEWADRQTAIGICTYGTLASVPAPSASAASSTARPLQLPQQQAPPHAPPLRVVQSGSLGL